MTTTKVKKKLLDECRAISGVSPDPVALGMLEAINQGFVDVEENKAGTLSLKLTEKNSSFADGLLKPIAAGPRKHERSCYP
jgi:hypothetical protein